MNILRKTTLRFVRNYNSILFNKFNFNIVGAKNICINEKKNYDSKFNKVIRFNFNDSKILLIRTT
jgi:hypothetical protein